MKYLSIVLLLITVAACGGQPRWRIASESVACTAATVIDRHWSDSNHSNFYLLLKTEDGEIGQAIVNAYVYDSLQIGDVTCVVR